jgi:hypothetical protein
MKKKTTSNKANVAWDSVQGNKSTRTSDGKSTMMSMMAEDSAVGPVVDNERLKELSTQIENMTKLDEIIKGILENLRQATDKYNLLKTAIIPDLFDELGMKSFTLMNGMKAEVKRDYAAAIKEEHKKDAFAWLRKNGHDSIIKHDIAVKIGKGDDELYKSVIEDLDILEADYDDKEKVHPQTLCAFVREQMEKGSDIPQETFGIFPIRVTKLSVK